MKLAPSSCFSTVITPYVQYMGIPYVPVFLITIPLLLVLNSCPIVLENLVWYAKWNRFFQVKQYDVLDNAYDHFDFPQWEKTSIGVGQ
jgi:hypothetical protein